MKRLFAFPALFLLFSCTTFSASAESFDAWVAGFKKHAANKGISQSLLNRAFVNMTPNEKVIRLDKKQPEGTMTFPKYMRLVINDARIAQGQKQYKKHKALLDAVAAKYGVQPRFIVALWGIETSYGKITGDYSVVRSLATLAYDGRRREFFTKELINALKIIDQGHIKLADMKGSWAGAMAQNQFMPSSFLAYAVDYDGDGKKDIWNNLPDVFGSIANYLSKSGWNDQQTWGRAVDVPSNVTVPNERKAYKPLSYWANKGVTKKGGAPLPDSNVQAALIYPGKSHEGAYLIYKNYNVIMRWNNSRYFATAVGSLSDSIAYGK